MSKQAGLELLQEPLAQHPAAGPIAAWLALPLARRHTQGCGLLVTANLGQQLSKRRERMARGRKRASLPR
jgi:hypothetical protein